MKSAVIFGAGNVGRGFVGELCSEAGMAVTFVDMSTQIVDALNKDHAYLHLTVSNAANEQKMIGPVKAISALDIDSVISAIESADLLATSVGAGALPKIARTMVLGIEKRIRSHRPPINILLCENLHGVADLMRVWLHAQLSAVSTDLFDAQVGLLTTSIGRMIPEPSEAVKLLHPAAIQVEPYKFLPFDARAVKDEMPDIPNLISIDQVTFDYYADRKLYIHNMGHVLCAYLSRFRGYTYIWEGIANPEIRYFVRNAMIESGIALSTKYHQPIQPIISHINDLLFRFSNRSLGDTIERVGRDPRRKLAKQDRLLGAYSLCAETGCDNKHLSLGLAAGLICLEESGDPGILFDALGYLQSQGLFAEARSTDEASCQLLISQMDSLREGFSFASQVMLVDREYSMSVIV